VLPGRSDSMGGLRSTANPRSRTVPRNTSSSWINRRTLFVVSVDVVGAGTVVVSLVDVGPSAAVTTEDDVAVVTTEDDGVCVVLGEVEGSELFATQPASTRTTVKVTIRAAKRSTTRGVGADWIPPTSRFCARDLPHPDFVRSSLSGLLTTVLFLTRSGLTSR
jgi:hypothetical protein